MEIITALKTYNDFLDREYNLVLGRKGNSHTIKIIFDKKAWFHVAGLHYLADIDIEQNKRSLVHFYDEILNGSISEDYFKRSVYYDSIQDRINILSKLDEIIESIDNTSVNIYMYSKKRAQFYTKVDGNYLIGDIRQSDEPINVFLVFEKVDDNTLIPSSAFPSGLDKRSGKPLDYSNGQMQFTLLLSTRKEISTDTYTELFRHPNYRE